LSKPRRLICRSAASRAIAAALRVLGRVIAISSSVLALELPTTRRERATSSPGIDTVHPATVQPLAWQPLHRPRWVVNWSRRQASRHSPFNSASG
jgi:hypothetical protein